MVISAINESRRKPLLLLKFRYAYVHNDPVNCVDLWGLTASDSRTISVNGKTFLTVNANDNQGFQDTTDAYFGTLKYGTAGNIRAVGIALTNDDGSVLHTFSNDEAIKKYYDSLPFDNENTLESLTFPKACELLGNTASTVSEALNAASLVCVVGGAFPLAGALAGAAAVSDGVAFAAYIGAGDMENSSISFVSLVVDTVSQVPNFRAAYNSSAQRFINDVTKRFIPNKTGYLKYSSFPAAGIILSESSKALTGEE